MGRNLRFTDFTLQGTNACTVGLVSAKNFKAFGAAIAPYLQAGRIQPRGTASRTSKSTDRDYDLPALREWAATEGIELPIELPQRGRIPQAVVTQYLGR